MARSTYFTNGIRSEQLLYEDLIIESIKIYGIDAYYIPRRITDEDPILNDSLKSIFDSSYPLEMYLDTNTAFGGEGELFAKFGLEIREQADFIIAQRRWDQDVGRYLQRVPMEGDLVWFPTSGSLFIIKFVEDEEPMFYQLGQLYVYKLQCELAELSPDMIISSGIERLDDLYRSRMSQTEMYVTLTNGDITFRIGDVLSQTVPAGYTISGDLLSVSRTGDSTYKISLGNISTSHGDFGYFVEGESASIGTSTFTVDNVITLNDSSPMTMFPEDQWADNQIIEKEADTILDFTETNPFGEP